MWLILTHRERLAFSQAYFVTVRSCVDNNHGGGTKGRSDRRRCANRNTCSRVFGCATELEDECTGDQLTGLHEELKHDTATSVYFGVWTAPPVCCGAKKVSLRPSGYLGFFTCKRRQHATASLPRVSWALARMACILFSTMLHELRMWRRSAHGALTEPFRTTLTCGADWSTRSGSEGHSNGESTGCATCVNFGEEERHAKILSQRERRDRWFKPDEDRSGNEFRGRSINGRTSGGDATSGCARAKNIFRDVSDGSSIFQSSLSQCQQF